MKKWKLVIAEGEGEGGAPKDGGNEYIPKAQFDALNTDKSKLESTVAELSSKLEDSQKKIEEITKKFSLVGDDPEGLLEELTKLREESDAAKLKGASELEKMQVEMDKAKRLFDTELKEKMKIIKALEEEKGNYSKIVDDLRRSSLRADLLSAASANDAHSPDQIVGLLIHDFKLGEDGVYKSHDGKSVQEHVKSYLARKENANLRKTTITPVEGTGDDKKPSSTDSGDKYKIDKDGYMLLGRELTPPEKKSMSLSGLSEREFIDKLARVKKGEEEAMKRIAKEREGKPIKGLTRFDR